MNKPLKPILGTAYKKYGDTVYLIYDDGSDQPWFSYDKNHAFGEHEPYDCCNCICPSWSQLEPLPLKECKYKIRVTPAQSEQIQKICFEQGIYWSNGEREVINTHSSFLFIDDDYGDETSIKRNDGNETFFNEDDGTEILAEDFMAQYGQPEPERAFRVGDVVKVIGSDCANSQDIGRTGVIEVDDGSAIPFKINFGGDDCWENHCWKRKHNIELITPVENKEPEMGGLSRSTYTTSATGGTLTLDSLREAYLAMREEPTHYRPIYLGWDFGIKTTGKQPKKGFMDTLRSIPKKLQRLMDKGMQARFQLGRLNDRLELTSEGQSDLMDYLADLHAEELGKRAIADLKEIKKSQKDEE